MENVQRRIVNAPAAQVGALIDRLARPDDPLWPAPAWPPLRLDRGLEPGSAGGHGPIRYRLSEYEPGRRVRFEFAPGLGIDGHHELAVRPLGEDRAELVHVLRGRTYGAARLTWPVAIRWLHEALIQDLFDRAETAAARGPERPASWSPWVRQLRRWMAPRPARVPLPPGAALARAELDRVDLLDAWRLPLPPGASRSPQAWREAIFESPPRWVVRLLRVRNLLAGPAGLDRVEPRQAFAERARTADEVLLGGDGRHFDLRISVLVGPAEVTCSTLTRARTARGRAYLALVGRIHPVVVRAMLARAGRTAQGAPGGGVVTRRDVREGASRPA